MDPGHLKTIPLFLSLSGKALDTVSVFAERTREKLIPASV
jgi:hypothetical protein